MRSGGRRRRADEKSWHQCDRATCFFSCHDPLTSSRLLHFFGRRWRYRVTRRRVVERALFPSEARISLIRSAYVRVPSSPSCLREAILIGGPPQTQLLSRKCCNTDGLTAAEFKMPTNKRTNSPPDRNLTKCRVVVVCNDRLAECPNEV